MQGKWHRSYASYIQALIQNIWEEQQQRERKEDVIDLTSQYWHQQRQLDFLRESHSRHWKKDYLEDLLHFLDEETIKVND